MCWSLAAGAFTPPAAAQVCAVCVPQPFSAQFSLRVLASAFALRQCLAWELASMLTLNMTHANRIDGQDRSWLSNPASHSSTGSSATLRRRHRCWQMCCRQWSRVCTPRSDNP